MGVKSSSRKSTVNEKGQYYINKVKKVFFIKKGL